MRRFITHLAAALAVLAAPAVLLAAEPPATNRIEPDGTVDVPAYRLPPSVYLSEEAKAALPRKASDMSAEFEMLVKSGMAPKLRAAMAKMAAKQVEALKAQYHVETEEVTIGGVHAVWARPAGKSAKRAAPVLVNLPGGGFVIGNAAGIGMLEAIPLVGRTGYPLLSIDYRQAPEAVFPAASEDVAAVYRALLKDHKPGRIGLFGCSAGGILTAQSLAWFDKEGLPMPGAAGIFCASADARWAGDSWHWQRPIAGLETPPMLDERFYYGDHDLADPLMSPVESDALLAKFPPTLLIAATRAGELSSAVQTHRLLVRNGVEADLHLWDGLGHAFYVEHGDLPESGEAFDVMARFFTRHLGNRK